MDKEIMKTLEELITAEKKMKERFEKLAEQADTPEMRALFQEMAHEEAGHEKSLSERLTTLKLMRK